MKCTQMNTYLAPLMADLLCCVVLYFKDIHVVFLSEKMMMLLLKLLTYTYLYK